MKHVGTVVDRQITPFITYTYLPNNTKYVDFPFCLEYSYSIYRYYSDELPMKWKDFNKLTKGKYAKSQTK